MVVTLSHADEIAMQAETYDQWKAAATELDILEGNEAWKEEDDTTEYNVDLVAARLKELDDARLSCDVKRMLFLVRTTLTRGLGDMGDLSKMMEAAQQMQTRMAEMQEGLTRMTVTGEAGAGLVKATATAKGELTALAIDPSIFREQDKEVVEDLILAAIKDAQRRAEGKAAEEMARLTRELGLPADMKMPF